MSLEFFGLLAFGLVCTFWNIYLMRQNSVLMDKLMSRNYSEYVQTKTFEKTALQQEQSEDDVTDPYEDQRTRELNNIMGMV